MTTLAATTICGPGLTLDKRQRAMLNEMGVQVWQPLPVLPVLTVAPAATVTLVAKTAAAIATPATKSDPASSRIAPISGADGTYIQSVSGTLNAQKQAFKASKTVPAAESGKVWRVGHLQTLYSPVSSTLVARWLILIEYPASALLEPFNPFEGDAGKLLDNMLRAANLHTAGGALLAPLVRAPGESNDQSTKLADELEAVFANAKADVVLVMGRLAAQALLQSAEPLAKLRGHAHNVHGIKTIVTIDPVYLLRNPLDKAKAWDDLCLAISVTGVVGLESAP